MYPQSGKSTAAALLAALLALAPAAPWPAAAQHRHTPESAPAVPAGPDARVGSLVVTGAWARATPPAARTGAAYLTIANEGTEADRLVAVASPAAGAAELHRHAMEGGIARMTAVAAVDIRPGEPAVFQPGGLHVMLLDLRAPLHDGRSFALTLTFARSGSVTVEVPVRRGAPAAARPAGPAHAH